MMGGYVFIVYLYLFFNLLFNDVLVYFLFDCNCYKLFEIK